MRLEPEAQQWINDYVSNAARRSGLKEPDLAEARTELYSHVYDAAADRAVSQHAESITLDHVQMAAAHIGSAPEVDAAFFAPRRQASERAPFRPRILAYLIDAVVAYCAAYLVSLPFLDYVVASWVYLFFPFAHLLPAALVVTYFAVFDTLTGQTPGKMVLNLRVTGPDGGPISWQQAFGRNLSKAFPPLVALDALLGHLSERDQRLRISDRYARTEVHRTEPDAANLETPATR